MSAEDRSLQDAGEESDPSWRPSRRGLIKAGAAAVAVSAIVGAGEMQAPGGASAAGDIIYQSWSEATEGGVHSAAVGEYRTAQSKFTFYALGSSWDGSVGAWPVVEYSFSSDGKTWGAPVQSPAAVEDGGRPNRDGRIFTQLVFLGGANYVRYRFFDGQGNAASVSGFQLFFIDATGGPSFGGASVSAAALPPLAQPTIISRAGWGCPQPNGYADAYGIVWPPEYQNVEHVIIHHSETLNETDGGDAVRSIYAYHTFDRGWGDIGYNYLVDKMGVIYEGRFGGTNVVGGHAFQYAFGSSGICAVGSFMTQDVTAACMSSMINIVAWVGRALNPLGASDFHQVRSLPTISGHRDTNQTECPGDVFYGDMNYIRTQVANRLNSTSHTPPPTPGPGPKFVTGDNVIFVSSTRLHVNPSVNSQTVVTASTGQYGAIDGAPRIVNGKEWQAVRVNATTEGYCQTIQLDFAPVGNPPDPIYELGDTVKTKFSMILRRSAGEAQNAPYSLSSGELLYVSGASVAATGSRWISVMSQDHATGYVKQEDITLAAARRVSVSPGSGVVGSKVNISVSGMPAIRNTSIYFSGIKVRSVVTNSSGSASTSFSAPDMVKGSRTVQAVVGVASASTKFTLNPSVTISPASGTTGSSATVTAHGFIRGETVTIQWLNGSTWTTLTSFVIQPTGSNAATITIPNVDAGTLSIRAKGSSSPTVSFTVTGAGPEGTATPTPTPPDYSGAYNLVGGNQSGDSQSNARVRDRNLGTYWRTNNTGVKSSAWVYVDLGSSKPIGEIRWFMGATGMAKDFSIRLTTGGSNWTELTTGTDSPAGTWSTYTLPTGQTARYVQFYFRNPTNTAMLGGIGEILVYPGTVSAAAASGTPTGSPTATPTGSPTGSPTGVASSTPIPTEAPTEIPTEIPTMVPTDTPTEVPTDTATPVPTDTPTETPIPTEEPTETPVPTDTP